MVFNKVKKQTLRLAGVLLCAVLVARLAYRCHYKQEPLLFERSSVMRADVVAEAAGDDLVAGGDLGAYNFSHMTQLIEIAKQLKADASCSFDGEVRKRTVSAAQAQAVYEDLLRERTNLHNYIWELKGQASNGIPVRKYRSLLYYLEVLDHALADMRILQGKLEK